MSLISRRTFPPQGFWFFESKTNWPRNPQGFFAGKTFDESVIEIIKHRLANPRFSTQWSTDKDVVADELDQFTCLRLANDPNYCAPSPGGNPLKKVNRLSSTMRAGVKDAVAAVEKVVAGAGVMVDWLGDGLKPVSQELANARATVCSTCPNNQPKDLLSFFTVPASDLIRQQIEIKNEMKLATPFDEKLGICVVCACPLRTKVWSHMEHVLKHLKPDVKSQLPGFCWMVKESQ